MQAPYHRLFLGVAGALIGLAWAVLWLWSQSPYGRFLSHEDMGMVHLGDSGSLLMFVAGWTLMIAAMMLPTIIPLVSTFLIMVRLRQDRTQLLTLLLIGYIGVWSIFGLVAHVSNWGVHQAVEHSPWLLDHAWLLGAVPLLLAGLYQFTPLKYYCLDKCRSPLSFIATRWHGRHPAAEALWLGVHNGLFCLGCCWLLMLLMFAVGVGNLGWMLVLGAVMFIEKTLPWGRRLSTPLGVLLLAWGQILILSNALALS
ncbi:MAG TPA: DUF2182 domain-containing protein [Chloroflexia bacterium]|jgi:predicted metal-binding membrane protein